MGIDVFLIWEGMTHEEWIKAQDIIHLREPYHGAPYATWTLLEGLDPDSKYEKKRVFVGSPHETEIVVAPVTAKNLRDRLPEVLKVAIERAAKVYHETATMDSQEVKAFSDFVELAEQKERAGKKLYICVSY
jgi:hypothetical protein